MLRPTITEDHPRPVRPPPVSTYIGTPFPDTDAQPMKPATRKPPKRVVVRP